MGDGKGRSKPGEPNNSGPPLQNVSDDAGEHEQALRKLQRDSASACLPQPPYSFMDLDRNPPLGTTEFEFKMQLLV